MLLRFAALSLVSFLMSGCCQLFSKADPQPNRPNVTSASREKTDLYGVRTVGFSAVCGRHDKLRRGGLVELARSDRQQFAVVMEGKLPKIYLEPLLKNVPQSDGKL
jgi:hypothetical protein